MYKIYNKNTLKKLKGIPANSVTAVITDPPYNYGLIDQDYLHKHFLRISSSGLVIVFSPPENQWIKNADQILFWVKPISTKNTSKSYARFVEMIFIYGRHKWNHDRHWSQYNNVFTDLVESKNHPYQKPLSLMERLVLNHTDKGDTILDPFMGSGTTGVACLLNERNFIGIEKDEERFQLAKDRLEKI